LTADADFATFGFGRGDRLGDHPLHGGIALVEQVRHHALVVVVPHVGSEEVRLEIFFQRQIERVDAAIGEAYDELAGDLAKLPGIGKVTAPAIIAEYGELSRFEGGYKKLLAYAGLDPRIRESGQWKGTVKMSKRGSPALRTALFKAASMGRLHCPQLQAIYHKHRHEKGKNHRVAISHVARKLVQLIWAVWRNGATYDPSKITPNAA